MAVEGFFVLVGFYLFWLLGMHMGRREGRQEHLHDIDGHSWLDNFAPAGQVKADDPDQGE